ncbi:Phosphopantothenate-cysteine ligase [Hathewaya proteolytica DSM 3090]|uniref:Coenzyme A biosynthesis bifunctional protein CoaBC n=1 Tax=Hathewaya proteolytica DSM 3090 TaxID=1121331 RepID=A0A1M6JAW7_9CLOT|nr:bifunctional phosphopantothenoylcysteine decarboxylase/phosphopantothenate--cysteine ligase CoaBC [Hathewaya proteolytica]SHJ43800.1 Phosphopantothenate-cysteine ligase [Hathewaya proteolytica DSM 3090]
MNPFCGKNVVLGVTGGIAAYKALDLVSRLKKKDINVDVIMTKSAMEFITPLSFQSLSQNPVVYDMFAEPKSFEIQHISLAKKADLLAIVPATANIIGKVSSGIADDMLSTTIMATKAKVVFAPAMNTNMYTNAIVQRNIAYLKELGYAFIEPEAGRLACGDIGTGKLASVDLIEEVILKELYPTKDMVGKKVLVTAGPNIAPIDPVRMLTNRSSGKMGYAMAVEARNRGAEVTLISGTESIKDPAYINVIHVDTNEEMYKAVLDNYDHCDMVVKSAAVADYKIKSYSSEKIKKKSQELVLEFVKDRDILMELGEKKKNQVLLGFAAESSNIKENAMKKMDKKNLDYIFVNNISTKEVGFRSQYNSGTLISKDGTARDFGKVSKEELAREIFNAIMEKR